MAKIKQLKDNSGPIYPKVVTESLIVDPYKNPLPGTLLALAKNDTKLDGTWGVKTVWSAGTWTQYGPQARTDIPYMIVIQNDSDYAWDVEVELIVNNAHNASGSWYVIGMAQTNGENTTVLNYISQTVNSNNSGAYDIWTSIHNSRVINIPAHSKRGFEAFVGINNGKNLVVLGSALPTTTSLQTDWAGDTCTIKATFLGRA